MNGHGGRGSAGEKEKEVIWRDRQMQPKEALIDCWENPVKPHSKKGR